MELNEKTVLQETVRKYVEAEHSDQLEEFDTVFDDVYDVVSSRMEEARSREETSVDEEGLPFDAGIVVGTAISTACWIGLTLLKAAIKYGRERGIKYALDKAEKWLVSKGANPDRVRKLREILEGILENL